ncbi:putative serine/threonine-protein kinase [Gracilariopsis chorda]|uniref:Putative serine/threonine-protein kinase n=1 Tax=Gracilariopsis chorda TaxID=448386 RepID=A0A2V3IGX0_9FLOR|nr:putative serine/threonine-protein kinase [Gracilariopsis chorda]|eukprot:PXF41331.1 putative serine/threonine-protein kinase [Gracilariopsis chorda]
MSWGARGESETLEGASGRTWTLRFERRLAPRETAEVVNPASTVWLVRDEKSARLYAAKRQNLASLVEVDALVDEAAAWRASCLADSEKHVIELEDVFVFREAPFAVIFLAEFCSRGLLPKRQPLSEPVLLTILADLSKAASVIPSPHAHIAYDSLLVDQEGRIRLAGFGAHRSAILRDNPGLTPNDDAFDIGLLVYELIFGVQPPESLEIPDGSPYSSRITDLISLAFSHPHPMQLCDRALATGAEPLAPVVNTSKEETSSASVPETISKATERNVDNLVKGVDIASSFSALLNDLNADAGTVSNMVFKALFKKPVSKDPLCAMRLLTMLHNLILDGPEGVLEAVRKNDKFMDWVETSWTREAVESSSSEQKHPSLFSFAGGELAFYSAFLRRKAKFHLLAAGGFTGRWDRTGAVSSEGRDVLTTRRRKVISGMADVIEMASELGCRFAAARDTDAQVKQTALGALVSECCLAFKVAEELAYEVDTVAGARKLEEGIARLYKASRELVFAVEHVPSAGGEEWVEHFASESAPDVVSVAKDKGLLAQELVNQAAQEQNEAIQQRKERKEEKRRKREEKERKKAQKQKEKEEKEKEPSAEDGALVVHGADEASKAITTLFGDLLALDGQPSDTGNTDMNDVPAAPPGLSNSQALASAFGVPEEVVGTQYGGLSDLDDERDDDDDDDSAYNDYQARQNQKHQQPSGPRQGSMTAAWAARSGYQSRALVVSEGMGSKKSHPVFCQCALCQREEEQAMAHQAESSGYGPNSQTEANYSQRPTTSQSKFGASGRKLDSAPQESHPTRKSEGASYYYDDGDSLDEADHAQYGSLGQAGNQSRINKHNPYHSDGGDCDSYESVTYSIEDHGPGEGFPIPRNPATAGVPPMASEEEQRPKHPYYFVPDKKRALNMKRLRLGEKISETTNILVYKGEYNREPVAIKKLSKAGLQSQDAREELTNEVKIICSLSHPRIMACVASCLEKSNFIFVTEFMKRGTLFDILHKQRIKLTWSLIRKISLQMAEGMCHIHEAGILHRDLKSLNIFVDNSFNIKIGDFGLARSASDNFDSGISGTYQYMAPEIIRGNPHSEKSDVYSYAIIVCEMVSGVPPFQGMEARQVAERVVQEDIRPSIPMNCQRAYVNLIQMCWGTVPSTRPSFSEIVGLITSTTK